MYRQSTYQQPRLSSTPGVVGASEIVSGLVTATEGDGDGAAVGRRLVARDATRCFR
jgi:hypothetical protein